MDVFAEVLGVRQPGGDFVVLGHQAVHAYVDVGGGGVVGVEVGGVAGYEVGAAAILGALEGLDDIVDEMDTAG